MPISFFQFDNLLKQRVHFFIFAWVDLSVLGYTAMEKRHLEQVTIQMPPDSGMAELKTLFAEKAVEKTAPVMLVCHDGKESRDLALSLEEQGYVNIFWVRGGLEGLMSEKPAAKS